MEVTAIPQFTLTDITNGTAFAMDVQYRIAFLFFIVCYAHLRDEEYTQDQRAGVFIAKFTQQLLTLMQ